MYSPSQRHGDIEDGEHPKSLLSREQVSDQRWSNGGVASFTDTYKESRSKQHPVILKRREREREGEIKRERERERERERGYN